MMCYRDKTFCKYNECLNWDNCDRALTDEVQAGADKWWGEKDAPVCLFAEHPECFKSKNS